MPDPRHKPKSPAARSLKWIGRNLPKRQTKPSRIAVQSNRCRRSLIAVPKPRCSHLGRKNPVPRNEPRGLVARSHVPGRIETTGRSVDIDAHKRAIVFVRSSISAKPCRSSEASAHDRFDVKRLSPMIKTHYEQSVWARVLLTQLSAANPDQREPRVARYPPKSQADPTHAQRPLYRFSCACAFLSSPYRRSLKDTHPSVSQNGCVLS
jgi:hypothetical protein